MPTPLHTPRVNNNDDVVRLIRLHIRAGDAVKVGDLVAEVETEKASYTVEAEQSGFVLSVIPQLDAMVEVGSVLMWIGSAPDELVPVADAPAASLGLVAEPTVKAAQLLARFGLQASDVPASGARLSARDVEEFVAHKGLIARASTSGRLPVAEDTLLPMCGVVSRICRRASGACCEQSSGSGSTPFPVTSNCPTMQPRGIVWPPTIRSRNACC